MGLQDWVVTALLRPPEVAYRDSTLPVSYSATQGHGFYNNPSLMALEFF
jgi:hypothetical protein